MAETNINILEVYNTVFGHVAAPYPAFIRGGIGNPLQTIAKTVKGSFNFKTEMGGENMFPLAFINEQTKERWQLPVEPLISINGSNRIVETPLTREDRVVNVLELINLNNYKIRIRGVFVSNIADEYPKEEVVKLRNLLEQPKSHQIDCPFLSMFGIDRIAIKNIGWPAVPGSPEMQGYSIDCISDTSVEIDLTEINNNNQ